MYGNSSKLGRGGPAIARGGGGGGGGPKRFPAPQPPIRPTAPSRPLSAGPRNRMNSGPGSAAPTAAEETFNLVSGNNSHVFGMIIRLAPDLIEEIKRLEAQGESARIKFDSNANNTAGNVIDVGGKEYRFTWSREFGDLCDIYEERQSGEEGNGLLVESGCAWRKLNVQRVLDESTKNLVKMRSEEAERKHKSRKAIVLEHGNASMKSQVKQLAAAEVNPRRMFFKKKEPPNKKQKVEPRQVSTGEFSRSAHKMGFSSAFKTNVKRGRSSSPLPLSPAQRNASISPSGADNLTRSSMPVEEAVHTTLMCKENAASSERDMMNKATASVKERARSKVNLGAKPTDLQSMLISLLTANPKGMSLKALEKAIGDTFPNSGKKIEPILKKIATYQAPGRYLLKSEADYESFKRSSSASGSSPEDNNNHIPVLEEDPNHTSLPEPAFAEKAPAGEGFAQLNSAVGEEMNASEDVDIEHHSPDLFDKASENSEGRAGSSSDSGSDSDSDSGSSDSRSESGSPSGSRSRSRSRSPIRSGSVSSSDSESDASSNSKEGSDQDVDIMTSDDEKEPSNKFQASEQGCSTPPEGRPVKDRIDNKQDGHDSDFVDIEKTFTIDEEADDHTIEGTGLISKKEHNGSPEENLPDSFKHDDFIERQNFIGSLFDEKETNFSDNFKSEHSDSHDKLRKDKSQREYDSKPVMNPERVKRLKAESLNQQPVAGISITQNSLSPSELSQNRMIEDSFKSSSHHIINRVDRDSDAELGLQGGWNQAYPGKSSLSSHQYGKRSLDQGNRATAHDPAGKSSKSESLGSDSRLSSKNFNMHESLDTHTEKSGKENFSEGHVSDKSSRSTKEGGSARKHYARDSHHQKIDETCSRFKEVEHTNLRVESSPKGNNRAGTHISPPVNGKGAVLQRELSDLELGELREPVADEAPTKKRFERKSSFKKSENKPNKSNSRNVDVARGKPPEKEPGKPSSPNLCTRYSGSTESISRKRTFENRGDDFTMPVQPGVQSQLPFPSKIDHGESGWQTSNMVDVNKSKRSEAGARRGINPEESRKSQKGASIEGTQHVDNKRGQASQTVKEAKLQASNTVLSTASGQKDAISADNSSYKRRESSSDENSPYSKYEKDEPELKGRIKDNSQYREYVQEYRDKYDSYCLLNKTLENYRDEFQKLGKELESAKGRDIERYNNLLQELKESYYQCGTKHKRLKKIFVVLHEELKNLKQMIKDYALSYSRD